MKYSLLSLLMAFAVFSHGGDKPTYAIFDKYGNATTYTKLAEAAKNADIILFGEQHNNPIIHWLQLELTKEIYEKQKASLILGAEMFEADVQLQINEYLKGYITDKKMEEESKIWSNYKTDYKPLMKYAKSKKLKFIATNIPRRYASIVADKNLKALDTLPSESKQFIAPLPIAFDTTLCCYKELLDMESEMADTHGKKQKIAEAQAIKDATMAHFILKNWSAGKTFIHFNGTYHSDNFESIMWYLHKQNPELKILTISNIEQTSIDKMEGKYQNFGDFIICVPESMTKTH